MNAGHPWKLVAPWYHWQRQPGRAPRQTRPVFQKFDNPDFVKGFVHDPQHSLKFKDDLDQVFAVTPKDAPKLTAGPLVGKLTRLFLTTNSSGATVAQDLTLVPTGVRKLYLDTHNRHYLVVCELHCDAPGFPTVTPDQVCQAGFVVRRRSSAYPPGLKKEAADRLNGIRALQTEIAYLEQTSPARGRAAAKRAKVVAQLKADGTFPTKLVGLHAKLADARKELLRWKDDNGVVPILEGWVAGPFPNVGSWQVVEEQPQEIVEAYFPLYRLFPDPNIPNHSAKGKNLYYGVVPTSSLDTDDRGNARLDHRARYELRCFVRRHDPHCPRRDEAPDCHGEVVWSEPTEPYQLAAPSDLVGTSQRPVTIQMPDLAELAAQAAALPLNQFSPMKVVQPQTLNFDVEDGKPKKGSGKTGQMPQICFFAIPLITLVAFFVFRLFLPILVFLFNLYFLLAFKLCILPSAQIDAGLSADLDLIPGGADVDVGLSASLTVQLNNDLKKGIIRDAGVAAADAGGLDQFSNSPLLPLGQRLKVVSGVPADAADSVGVAVTASLEYEARVEVTP
jgi:hypothetical protein